MIGTSIVVLLPRSPEEAVLLIVIDEEPEEPIIVIDEDPEILEVEPRKTEGMGDEPPCPPPSLPVLGDRPKREREEVP